MPKLTVANNRALSQKPLGYVLAILGGTLGGPLGWITSPMVLFGLNRILKEEDGKHPDRFLIWALAGIIGAPLSPPPSSLRLIGRVQARKHLKIPGVLFNNQIKI